MWLRLAHERLDTAVIAAYGWEAGISDDELLTRLLALNLEREALSGVAVAVGAGGAVDEEEADEDMDSAAG